MWALRRASLRLRNRVLNLESPCTCIKLSPVASGEDEKGTHESRQIACIRVISTKTFCHQGNISLSFTMGRRELSSQADASSTEDDSDMEDEREAHGKTDAVEMDIADDDDDAEELELSDIEVDPAEKRTGGRKPQSELLKAILNAPGLSVHSALDKWIEEGKELSREEISLALVNLRKLQMYGRALQLFQWLESNKKLEFGEREYVSQLDLIAKVRGLPMAEKFIERIPESLRGEKIYRTLLANCVMNNNFRKAEEIFNKIKDLDLPITGFVCDQLLLMYKRVDKKKIADVLLLMEKENIKPSLLTYSTLIDAKGRSNDIAGMDQVVETMKAEGNEPDHKIQALLARHYISAGLKERAKAILKELEGENLKENRWVTATLLRLYADLGTADEVERIWKVCEPEAGLDDCLAAIEAFGKLNQIEKAEEVFKMTSKKWKLSSKFYAALLKAYADNKMLLKGKDLFKQMIDSGCSISPMILDALVKLYVHVGEVEKADSILQKAILQLNQVKIKPLFGTFMGILEEYAKRGDVHNSEKIFHRMREFGYISRLTPFQVLLNAYINAKMPAYGMRERMKADNIFPNKGLAGQLVQVDAFRKTAVSYLLD